MNAPIIKLELVNDAWVAHHFDFDGSPAADVIDLFDTNTITTAFTGTASADFVIAKIRSLNAGASVSLV